MNDARTPGWVWTVALLLAGLQLCLPVMLVTGFGLPEGTAATGLHIPDSALFLQSLRMFCTGFESPYATCQSTHGDHSLVFYSVPHLWLYGVLGIVYSWLPIHHLLFWGATNAIGALFFLIIVHRFLRELAPRHANAAFLLFAVSGGPGGLLYLLAGYVGLHAHPLFEPYFTRFALYDLMEGPNLNPTLYFPRLYYTLSLALCLGGLTALMRASRTGVARGQWLWAIPVALGSFIDARYSVFTLALVAMCLWHQPALPLGHRLRLAAGYAVPAAFGLAGAWALMRINPAVVENHLAVANMAMWFSPFVVTAWLHLSLALMSVLGESRALPRLGRFLAGAALGYLAAFALRYMLYQGYYGNLLTGRDGSVAARISDPALLGALLGALAVRRWRPEGTPREAHGWAVLWLLLFLAASLSGWGQGWFLRFGPQRLQVFLWLPLCLFAAIGLARLRPALSRAAWSVLLGCGGLSVLVAVFAFQGPVGRAHAMGLFKAHHAELMSENDAALLRTLPAGRTALAPALASDVIALGFGMRLNDFSAARPRVVFGIGSFNLTGQPYVPLKKDVDAFFDPGTSDALRREIARRWRVDIGWCPETWLRDGKIRAVLLQTPWLKPAGARGDSLLFEVQRDRL